MILEMSEQEAKLYWDILVKASDGGGKGHAGRVSNWVINDLIKNRVCVLLHRAYEDMVKDVAARIDVQDKGYRVNLDKKAIWQKFNNGEIAGNVHQAAANYYMGLMGALHENIRLFYLDDQNSPETLFLREIGKVLGIEMKDIEDIAPKSRIAVEMETQEIYDHTMLRALKKADYIHLSSDKEFLDIAADRQFDYHGLDFKVISMGFPLSDDRRKALSLPKKLKEKRKKEVIDKYNPGCKNLIYCSFGGGRGAEDVYNTIDEIAGLSPELLVAFRDSPDNREAMKQRGFDVEDLKDSTGKVIGANINRKDNFRLIRGDHLGYVATADINLTACGSGGTYESVYTGSPLLAIPLYREGFEQVIKGVGVERCGGGKALFLPDMLRERSTRDYLKQIGFTGTELNAANAGAAIDDMFTNMSRYNDSIKDMKRFYRTEDEIAQQVVMMLK